MEQAAHGDEVYFRGDHARVAFNVPLGADPDSYFEKAKQEYLRKLNILREQLQVSGRKDVIGHAGPDNPHA